MPLEMRRRRFLDQGLRVVEEPDLRAHLPADHLVLQRPGIELKSHRKGKKPATSSLHVNLRATKGLGGQVEIESNCHTLLYIAVSLLGSHVKAPSEPQHTRYEAQ